MSPVLWPDFTRAELYEAILDFQSRDRRFGRVSRLMAPWTPICVRRVGVRRRRDSAGACHRVVRRHAARGAARASPARSARGSSSASRSTAAAAARAHSASRRALRAIAPRRLRRDRAPTLARLVAVLWPLRARRSGSSRAHLALVSRAAGRAAARRGRRVTVLGVAYTACFPRSCSRSGTRIIGTELGRRLARVLSARPHVGLRHRGYVRRAGVRRPEAHADGEPGKDRVGAIGRRGRRRSRWRRSSPLAVFPRVGHDVPLGRSSSSPRCSASSVQIGDLVESLLKREAA